MAYQIGIALPEGNTTIFRWIEKNHSELNLGRCPPLGDDQIRAVISANLDNADNGGLYAAQLIREAAEAVGAGGELQAHVELWPDGEAPPANFADAGTVKPGTVGNRIGSEIWRKAAWWSAMWIPPAKPAGA